jgi:hypothetical protein
MDARSSLSAVTCTLKGAGRQDSDQHTANFNPFGRLWVSSRCPGHANVLISSILRLVDHAEIPWLVVAVESIFNT